MLATVGEEKTADAELAGGQSWTGNGKDFGEVSKTV